jgi:hypothetical protein
MKNREKVVSGETVPECAIYRFAVVKLHLHHHVDGPEVDVGQHVSVTV